MSDRPKVVPLWGCSVPTPHGEPVPAIVEELEKALNEARNGNMRAFALCYVVDDGTAAKILESRFAAVAGAWRDLWFEFGALHRKLGKAIDE